MQDTFDDWDIGHIALRPDIFIPGSPERCVERSVVEDDSGKLWVLERLTQDQVARRKSIARNLEQLFGAGFTQQAPYARTQYGSFTAKHDGRFWQLSPYMLGDALPQPGYIDEPERGCSLARLLLLLRDAASGLELEDARPGLMLPPYISGLTRTIRQREPEIGMRLVPVLDTLTPFMDAYAELPTAFNHGDFHPINVIWQFDQAIALIDWEFCGYRPVLFDAANLLGCVGIEDPQALTRALAPSLIKELKRGDMADETSMRWLPALVLAQRFAWLSEWLRKKDSEMIGLELHYMNLMAANLDALAVPWNKL